jgi:hypothetical protein
MISCASPGDKEEQGWEFVIHLRRASYATRCMEWDSQRLSSITALDAALASFRFHGSGDKHLTKLRGARRNLDDVRHHYTTPARLPNYALSTERLRRKPPLSR